MSIGTVCLKVHDIYQSEINKKRKERIILAIRNHLLLFSMMKAGHEETATQKEFEEIRNTEHELLKKELRSGEELSLKEITYLALRNNPDILIIA